MRVAVTTLPASLNAVIGEVCTGKLGKLIVLTVPNPLACADWNTGVKDETTSTPPAVTLPALAAKTLELLGEIAA